MDIHFSTHIYNDAGLAPTAAVAKARHAKNAFSGIITKRRDAKVERTNPGQSIYEETSHELQATEVEHHRDRGGQDQVLHVNININTFVRIKCMTIPISRLKQLQYC